MKIKTADLVGPALDWAVAKCEEFGTHAAPSLVILGSYVPSRYWNQGGPIIEREGITVSALYAQNESPIKEFQLGEWGAYMPFGTKERGKGAGPTPLIAAMRCYVASKLGDEIEIPEELLK